MQLDSIHLPPELPWELLDRYLANTVSDEERAKVDAYLRDHPAVANNVRAFAGGVARQGITDPGVLRNHVWDNIRAVAVRADMTNAQDSALPSLHASSSRSLSRRLLTFSQAHSRLWMTVATLCLVIIGGYSIVNTSSIQSRVFATADRPNLRRLSTGKGQRASIELTDGTKVTLNVSSTITIPPDFGERDRVIHLDGEALFEVPGSAGKPFIVKTATSSTRVLGTQFTVREYSEDQSAVTTVIQGKVDVAGTVLTASQQGVRTRDGRVAVSSIDNAAIGDWVAGQIAFNRTALQDVITELNRWYDTEFVLDDTTLATELVTLRFHNRSASEVATVLTDILGIRYRKNGPRIVFTR